MAMNFTAPLQPVNQPNNTVEPPRQPSVGMFGNSGNVKYGVMARGTGSETVGRIRDGIVKYLSDINDGVSASVITIEGNGLAYTTILVCMMEKASPTAVAYHALLLEQTGKKPEPLTISEGGVTISHPRVPSDAFDAEMYKVIDSRLRREFPTANIINAGGSVVYKDQELFFKNQEGESALSEKFRDVLYKVCNLVSTELNMHLRPGEDIDLSEIIRNELNNNTRTSLVIGVRQERETLETDTGNVVRSDVNISLRSKRISTGAINSLNGGQQLEEFGSLNGYIDVVNMGSQNGFFVNQANVAPQRYAARLVITAIQSNIAFTPGAILLMLNTILPIQHDSNWVTLLRSKNTNRKEIDFTDIGALGIESNLTPTIPDTANRHIDTKSESVTPSDFANLVYHLLHPNIAVSLDVMDHDVDSSYMDVFSIAYDNPANSKTREIIYKAANTLTGGNFSKYMPSSDSIFTDQENRIHMGYFTRNGKRHDVREIDYIAVANYASATKDVLILRRWAQSFNDKSKHMFIRLAERLAIINEITGGSFVQTGYASRVTFTGRFMDALSNAITAAGMVTETAIATTASSMTDGVTQASFFADAVTNPNYSSLRGNGGGMTNSRNSGVGFQAVMPDRFI